MPAATPIPAAQVTEELQALGRQIQVRRKALRITATSTAEAAGLSRVTLHRIERGEPAVTMGAYLNVMAALGLAFGLQTPHNEIRDTQAAKDVIPVRIPLKDYPQLKQLAWQVGSDTLTPVEALDIYERNQRHLDVEAMPAHERELIARLRRALGKARRDV